MSVNDFIIELGNLNYKMGSHNVKLPDLAFTLLDGASVSENQRQIKRNIS